MNTRPSEIKRLITSKGLRKDYLAKVLSSKLPYSKSTCQSYISHILNNHKTRSEDKAGTQIKQKLIYILNQ